MEELKIPFEIEQESTQHSNKKDEVNEKNKRKRRQSSNVVDDSWLPARWKILRDIAKMINSQSYRAPGVRKIFRSKKQALEYIEEQKLTEAERGEKSLEDIIREAQVGETLNKLVFLKV
ncbi:hypothetical protein HAX54_042924 [Datura stramonium]|uniref:Uncharacterized protein n=1 Tax=Datura stramonium TaxID=4076 RepID=A0ABS8SMK3_DATST|nr:hypothetical protein [Datura stramonium]